MFPPHRYVHIFSFCGGHRVGGTPIDGDDMRIRASFTSHLIRPDTIYRDVRVLRRCFNDF